MSKPLEIVVSPRRVIFYTNRYIITLPRPIGRVLHKKLVEVRIKVIEGFDGDGDVGGE